MKKVLSFLLISSLALSLFAGLNDIVLTAWIQNGIKMSPVVYDGGIEYKATFTSGKSKGTIVADTKEDYIAFVFEFDVDTTSMKDLLVHMFLSSGMHNTLGEKILDQFKHLDSPTGFFYEGEYYIVKVTTEDNLWIAIYD